MCIAFGQCRRNWDKLSMLLKHKHLGYLHIHIKKIFGLGVNLWITFLHFEIKASTKCLSYDFNSKVEYIRMDLLEFFKPFVFAVLNILVILSHYNANDHGQASKLWFNYHCLQYILLKVHLKKINISYSERHNIWCLYIL